MPLFVLFFLIRDMQQPVLHGRTALQVYGDFMISFRIEMDDHFKNEVFSEIVIGLGPAGELRYPSFPEIHRWNFPGYLNYSGNYYSYTRRNNIQIS